jgi:hypothetical protein
VASEVKTTMADEGITVLDATVEVIDASNRVLTVRGPKGNRVTMKIGPYAKNVEGIKVGDTLRVEYRQPVITVMKRAVRPEKEGSSRALSLESEKPAGRQDLWSSQTVTIEKVDATARVLTFRARDGKSASLSIAPKVKELDDFKVGDLVLIRCEEALALSIVPRPPAK